MKNNDYVLVKYEEHCHYDGSFYGFKALTLEQWEELIKDRHIESCLEKDLIKVEIITDDMYAMFQILFENAEFGYFPV